MVFKLKQLLGTPCPDTIALRIKRIRTFSGTIIGKGVMDFKRANKMICDNI